jgi:capsular exopolysaccharide synthesis family protein
MNNHDTLPPASNDGPLINWHYLRMIGTRHFRLFLWVCLPVVGVTILYLLAAHRMYGSTAVVQVEHRAQRAIQSINSQSNAEDLTSEDSVKTIEQNMQSYDLFEAVVSNPQIANDPNFLVGYSGRKDPPSVSDLADWLQSNTKIALRHGTRLIDVTVYHRVPEVAQKLAQSLVDSYVLLASQAQATTQQNALKLLSSESADIKQKLETSEASLETYKVLMALKHRIDDQQSVVDALKERYRAKHPQMIQARALLAQLDEDFDKEFQKTVANPSNSVAAPLNENEKMAAASLLENHVSNELKLVEARSQVLQMEVDTESTLFNNLLKQMRETDVVQDSVATDIRLVEPPILASKPSHPKKTIILLLGLSMGVFLGLSAVVAIHTIENTIDTPMDAETALGLPVLGTILLAPSKKASGASSANPGDANPTGSISDDLVGVANPGGATAEGFRSLRAVINLLGKPSEHRTILFTSALSGEGKTFVSCNYAFSLAQTGLKTLLIDADLRRPDVRNRLKLENTIGLFELLTQNIALSQAVHTNVAKNLDVLTAGGACPNPAELLAGSGFKEILAKALANYDRIVVDTGPVNLVSDCLLIAPDVDMVCLVIRASSTSRQALKHALGLLSRAHKEPSGIVLNAIAPGGDQIYLGYKGRGGVGSYGKSYS